MSCDYLTKQTNQVEINRMEFVLPATGRRSTQPARHYSFVWPNRHRHWMKDVAYQTRWRCYTCWNVYWKRILRVENPWTGWRRYNHTFYLCPYWNAWRIIKYRPCPASFYVAHKRVSLVRWQIVLGQRQKSDRMNRKNAGYVNIFNSKDLFKQTWEFPFDIFKQGIVGNIYPTQRLATARTNAKEKKKEVNK